LMEIININDSFSENEFEGYEYKISIFNHNDGHFSEDYFDLSEEKFNSIVSQREFKDGDLLLINVYEINKYNEMDSEVLDWEEYSRVLSTVNVYYDSNKSLFDNIFRVIMK